MFYLTNNQLQYSSILTWDTLTPTTNPSYQQFYCRNTNEHYYTLVYSAVIMEKLSLTCGNVTSVLVKTPNSHMSGLLLKPIDQCCFASDEYQLYPSNYLQRHETCYCYTTILCSDSI